MHVKWSLVKKRPLLDEVPRDTLDKIVKGLDKVNKCTQKSWGHQWISNLKENVKFCNFKKHSAYQFKNKFKGRTAYLVGASPSLKYNVKYLKKKKGLIFTNSHNLKFLLSKGIKPDFTVIVDSKKMVASWLDLGNETKNMKLFCSTEIHPDAIKAWKGPIWFFTGHTKKSKVPLHKKLNKISDFNDMVSCGGSVMGAAYYMADGMGCKRIVFVGMDLANGFNTSTIYANDEIDKGDVLIDDNDYEKTKKLHNAAFSDHFIGCDIQGKGISTLARMFHYKVWFDRRSLDRPMEHINATEGGILGAYLEGNLKSIKQMRLRDVN